MPRSVFLETYGCAFNAADSETLEALLDAAGYALASDESAADVVVLNSCTVKDRTYLDFRKRLSELRRAGRAVVVAGCIPAANPRDPALRGVATIGPNDLSAVVEAVDAAAERRAFSQIRGGREERLALPSARRNPAVEILPINQGCLSACTFCQTRLARGRLHSFEPLDLLRRAQQAIEEGVREIYLTSQDTGAYGADIGFALPSLIQALASLDGDFKIRVGMMSPQWAYRDLKRLMEAMDSERVYQFLHVPLQSGDDEVLRDMRRGNTAAQFEEIVETFRARFPRAAIWTDIIVGFPTESDAAFERTLEVLRRARPATVNRSRFSARPKTLAARMRQIHSRVIAERSKRLDELVQALSRQSLAEWSDWEGEAWVSEVKRPGSAVARNFAYRPIILEGDYQPGQKMNVRIAGHTTYHLNGLAAEDGGRRRDDSESFAAAGRA